MRSSQEIMEILKQTYPNSMRKSFDNSEDALRWVSRKCENFEKIFNGICSERIHFNKLSRGMDSYIYELKTSDKSVFFKFIVLDDEVNYNCYFEWGVL